MVAGGRYFPSCEAAKKISTLAIHSELNSCFRELVYPKKKVSKYSTKKSLIYSCNGYNKFLAQIPRTLLKGE